MRFVYAYRKALAHKRRQEASGEKRPADVNQRAVMIGRIATGELADDAPTTESNKNPAAVALGCMGAKARAAGISARKRKKIARKAASG